MLRASILACTALTPFLFATHLAWADGGAGGAVTGGQDPGASGGTGFSGNAGADGNPVAGGAGGGGGAAGGGHGGNGGGLNGGIGAVTPGYFVGPDGAAVSGNADGNSGGGGAGAPNGNGAGTTNVNLNGGYFDAPAGGRGGNGSAHSGTGHFDGAGGGGGAGGHALIVTGNGAAADSTLANVLVFGGGGGTGGNSGGPTAKGGNGGDGGNGILFTGSGATTLDFLSSQILGGDGGVPGNNGLGGTGGAGIKFTGDGFKTINVVIPSSIGGGNGGSGFFTGGRDGDGGAGIVVSGNGGASISINGVNVSGGNGRNGGNGIELTGSGNKTLMMSNGASIDGGIGGAQGVNGAGVIGSHLTIVLDGALIVGGFNANTNAGGIGVIGSDVTISSVGAGGSIDSYGSYGVQFTGGTNFISSNTGLIGGINVAAGSFQPALPGSIIGNILMMNGPLVFGAGTIYNIRVLPSASDGIITFGGAANNGTANLSGATVNAQFVSTATFVARQYAIVTAQNGFGGTTFAGLTSNAPGGTTSLSYGTVNGSAVAFLNITTPFSTSSLNLNQQSVANGLTNYFNATGGLPGAFFNLTANSLTQSSGQSASGATQTSSDASNSLMGAMFDPFAAGRAGGAPAPRFAAETDPDDAMAYAGKRKLTKREREARNAVRGTSNNLYDPRWSVWGTAYGGSSKTNGDAATGSSDTTSNVFGFVSGADYNVNARTTVGFALGGGGSNYGVAGNLGTGRAEMFQLGLFAKHVMGAAYVSGGLAYTFQNVTADRTVTVAGTDQLRATFNANTFAGRVEGGYRFATPVVGVTPYAALQVTNISLPSYGEVAISGNNTFALNYNAQDTTIVRTELGARFDRSYALQTAMLTLRGRAAWAHDEGNNRNVSAVFGSLPGSNFTVNGAVPSKDLALVSAGADLAMLNNVTLSGMFEGQFSDTTTGFGGKGTVRYVW